MSKWPSFDGRFPGVSGIVLKFREKSGERIAKSDIQINGEPIDYNKIYTMATKFWVASGMDGFPKIPESDYIVKHYNKIIDR